MYMYYDHSCFLYENKTCQFLKIFRCLKVISYDQTIKTSPVLDLHSACIKFSIKV